MSCSATALTPKLYSYRQTASSQNSSQHFSQGILDKNANKGGKKSGNEATIVHTAKRETSYAIFDIRSVKCVYGLVPRFLPSFHCSVLQLYECS